VTRLVFFVLKIGVFVALVIWLADRPGTAHIVWQGYEIKTSAALLALAVLAIGFVFYLLWRLWRFIVNGPEMWRLRRRLGRMHDGHRRLTEGLAAIAAGDASEAGRHAVASRKLLGTTPATQLLQAQAAQLAGDHDVAREIFLALAAEPESAVLGYRGLIMGALRRGDRNEVDRLIEKLRRLRPETPWLKLVDFDLAAQKQDWNGVNIALDHIAGARLMDQTRVKQHQAAALIATAQKELRGGHSDQALQAAERAARLAPAWAPAVIALAREQARAGHKRASLRTIEHAWGTAPHPQLASLYRANAGDNAVEIYKKIEHLCGDDNHQAANRRILAEAALAADLSGEARRHLMALVERGEATRSDYRLLAQLERRDGGKEELATKWLSHAIDAPADPAWLCRVCGGSHEEWQALCRHCGAFDALEWQTPGQSRVGDKMPAVLLESVSRLNE
jgi:HemY protein